MDLDSQFGIRSSFQVVPDAPWSSKLSTKQLVAELKRRGFEVNVHDLTHDGHLFRNRDRFLRHATAINARGREFGSRGFRSGAMYRRQGWFAALDISYDMSVPNVAHLEPQAGGCCTVMPFFMGHVLELPLTAAQDYTVFHILGEYSTRLWQEQIDRILEQNGLISFIAHPDYLVDPRARAIYTELLRPPGRAPRRARGLDRAALGNRPVVAKPPPDAAGARRAVVADRGARQRARPRRVRPAPRRPGGLRSW